ncbi:unnamed protein product, partial [Symbiodinium sp. KB8]
KYLSCEGPCDIVTDLDFCTRNVSTLSVQGTWEPAGALRHGGWQAGCLEGVALAHNQTSMRLTLHFDESPVKVRVFMNGTLAPYGELRLEGSSIYIPGEWLHILTDGSELLFEYSGDTDADWSICLVQTCSSFVCNASYVPDPLAVCQGFACDPQADHEVCCIKEPPDQTTFLGQDYLSTTMDMSIPPSYWLHDILRRLYEDDRSELFACVAQNDPRGLFRDLCKAYVASAISDGFKTLPTGPLTLNADNAVADMIAKLQQFKPLPQIVLICADLPVFSSFLYGMITNQGAFNWVVSAFPFDHALRYVVPAYTLFYNVLETAPWPSWQYLTEYAEQPSACATPSTLHQPLRQEKDELLQIGLSVQELHLASAGQILESVVCSNYNNFSFIYLSMVQEMSPGRDGPASFYFPEDDGRLGFLYFLRDGLSQLGQGGGGTRGFATSLGQVYFGNRGNRINLARHDVSSWRHEILPPLQDLSSTYGPPYTIEARKERDRETDRGRWEYKCSLELSNCPAMPGEGTGVLPCPNAQQASKQEREIRRRVDLELYTPGELFRFAPVVLEHHIRWDGAYNLIVELQAIFHDYLGEPDGEFEQPRTRALVPQTARWGEDLLQGYDSSRHGQQPGQCKDMRKEVEATATRAMSEQSGETGQTANKSRTLTDYVRFETKEGVALLYEPHPLDKWIGKDYRWDNNKQLYMDSATGGTLTAEESEDYQRYLQRHNERRQTGGQADELIKLAAKINPRTLVELRFYIAKFPWEVCRLLAEGKKVYKSMGEQRELHKEPKPAKDKKHKKQKKETKEGKKAKKKDDKKQTKTENDDTAVEKDVAQAIIPPVGTPAEDPDHEVDWGGSDTDTAQPAKTTFSHDMGGSRAVDDNTVLPDTLLEEATFTEPQSATGGKPVPLGPHWNKVAPGTAGARSRAGETVSASDSWLYNQARFSISQPSSISEPVLHAQLWPMGRKVLGTFPCPVGCRATNVYTCVACRPGFYRPDGETGCVPCTQLATDVFQDSWAGAMCFKCPTGAFCDASRPAEAPIALPGYFRVENQTYTAKFGKWSVESACSFNQTTLETPCVTRNLIVVLRVEHECQSYFLYTSCRKCPPFWWLILECCVPGVFQFFAVLVLVRAGHSTAVNRLSLAAPLLVALLQGLQMHANLSKIMNNVGAAREDLGRLIYAVTWTELLIAPCLAPWMLCHLPVHGEADVGLYVFLVVASSFVPSAAYFLLQLFNTCRGRASRHTLVRTLIASNYVALPTALRATLEAADCLLEEALPSNAGYKLTSFVQGPADWKLHLCDAIMRSKFPYDLETVHLSPSMQRT